MTNDELYAILEGIRGDADHLQPDALVQAAEPEDHPLHDRFEWDNVKAGHEFRVIQARNIIRGVGLDVRVVEKNITVRTIAYQHDADLPPGMQGYLPTARVLSDREAADRQIRQAFSEAAKHLERARNIALTLGSGENEIASLLQDIERLAKKWDGDRPTAS